MASVYILYSPSLKRYYTGSCKEVIERLDQHLSKHFQKAFTKIATDWILFFSYENLNYSRARKTELYIKKMKSKKFIENLKVHPEIFERILKLIE
jgi:putative endonuclease